MKIALLGLTFLMSVSAFANTTTYTNDTGCTVEVENRAKGVTYYVTQGNKSEYVSVTNDLNGGTFVYCHESALQVNSFVGSQGTRIMMACSGHQNDNAVTRGRVDISIMGGDLEAISIDGQVEKFFGWKQDTKVECLNLVKQ